MPTLTERMAVIETKFETVVEPMAERIIDIHKNLHENGLVDTVNDIQLWRKKMNKVLLWFITCFTSVGLFIIYQIIRDAFK